MSDAYSFEPYNPDVATLAQKAQEAFDAYPSPETVSRAEKDVAEIGRERIAVTDEARDRQIGRIRSDLQNIDKKYDAISPVDVKPWKPEENPISNPLEAFGSYAGVWAMIASAATRQPIENTLNAGAAAITSVRDADANTYKKNFQAWKENNDLAFKVHEAERQDYSDAIVKLKAGQVGSEAELSAVAAKYGDKVVQTYLEAGMSDKALEIIGKRADLAQKTLSIQPQLMKVGQEQYENILFQQRVKEINEERKTSGQPMLNAQELMTLRGQMKDQFLTGNEDALRTVELERRAVTDENEKRRGAGQPPLTAEEEARLRGNVKRLANQSVGTMTSSKQEMLAVMDRATQIQQRAEATGKPIQWDQAYTQAVREIKTETGVITPNKRNEIQNHVKLIDESSAAIERVEKTIEKYVGATGIPGRALRMKERLGNLMGNNQTDRDHLMRDIEYLRLNAPRLLTNSPARPLAADVNRINTIVAGLEWGDTSANTLRALEEIRGIYARSRAASLQQLSGNWTPGEPAAPGVTPPPTSGTPPAQRARPWDADPIVGR